MGVGVGKEKIDAPSRFSMVNNNNKGKKMSVDRLMYSHCSRFKVYRKYFSNDVLFLPIFWNYI